MTGPASRGARPLRVTVSVIIVNWNAGQALDACLASLAAGGVSEPEVVLVDNASSDGSRSYVKKLRREDSSPLLFPAPAGDGAGIAILGRQSDQLLEGVA